MEKKELLLEIMENTIGALDENKDSVVSLIHNMQNEHEKKKQELNNIKEAIPKLVEKTEDLTYKDRKLRQELSSASSDFSAMGKENLKSVYDEANKVHIELQRALDEEQSLIRRRNGLELDLKQNKFFIQQAENMAHQLIVSLSYLQTGMKQINEDAEIVAENESSAYYSQYMSFLKSIESEKLKIARDLHDGPAQAIASAQMRVDFCKTIIKHDLEKGLLVLDNLKSDLSVTLSDVRNILFDLTPAPLEKMGLKGSIENLLNTTLNPNSTSISFYFEIHNPLNNELEIAIYRIIQELVTNIKKHAKATEVMIRLSATENHVYIHVMDNGIGFDVPSDLDDLKNIKKSYGLSNIATRIQDLNGKLSITSDKNKGTIFKAQLQKI